jgi:predicted AAA+ superfamily ATPase
VRVLADRSRSPARFLLLGSASPALLRQSSESLAGRIAYLELPGFGLADVGARWPRLWLRGGYPRPYLAHTDEDSIRWRRDLIRTYVEQDLPQLGVAIGAGTLHRFWTMLAHYHAQIWNGAELARAFGIAESTVKRYLDLLVNTFMVRVLPPWSENIGKRVVKTPKVYVADPACSTRSWTSRTPAPSAVTPRSAPRSKDSRSRRWSGSSARGPSSATSGRPIRAPSWTCWWCRDAGVGDSSSSAPMPPRPRSRCTWPSGIWASTRST